MRRVKSFVVCALTLSVLLGALAGCSSGGDDSAGVNKDMSKPGQTMPSGLQQADGAGGAGKPASEPATAQTGA
jgi:hypothetical protein